MKNPSPVQLINRIMRHLSEDFTWRSGTLKEAAIVAYRELQAMRNARPDFTRKRPPHNFKGRNAQYYTA